MSGFGSGTAAHGGRGAPSPVAAGERVTSLTVLYDAGCRMCRSAQRWLASRPQLVPLEFVPAGTEEARRRFPELDPAATLRDLTVISDRGLVYSGDSAWLACLWALEGYRGWAERFASPTMLPLARRAISMAAEARLRSRAREGWDPEEDQEPSSCGVEGCT
jgi:predicted DCC family thiol-disulfide oxidoreductase YuxK